MNLRACVRAFGVVRPSRGRPDGSEFWWRRLSRLRSSDRVRPASAPPAAPRSSASATSCSRRPTTSPTPSTSTRRASTSWRRRASWCCARTCDFEAGKREKVLGTWDEQADEHKVNVKLQGRGQGDHRRRRATSRSTLTNGEEIKAETVILGDRHAGQSQPDALRRRRPAARPVPARRSRRICRRAYHRDRRRATPASRTRSASPPIRSRATPSPSSTARAEFARAKARQCRPADGGAGRRAA